MGRLRLLTHALDIQLYQQRDNDDIEIDDEKKDFYDDSFNFYIAQINRIDIGLKDWIIKSNDNKSIIKKLDIAYHSKFRPLIFKQLTSTRYIALSEAANKFDEDIFVPDDVIGVIWMF